MGWTRGRGRDDVDKLRERRRRGGGRGGRKGARGKETRRTVGKGQAEVDVVDDKEEVNEEHRQAES
jgi:hypothetical protein